MPAIPEDPSPRHREASPAPAPSVKAAAGAAAESAASIADALPDIVLRYDRDGRILFVNESIRAATGRAPESFIGQLAPDVSPTPEIAANFSEARRTVFATGQAVTFEVARALDRRVFEYRMVPEQVTDGVVQTVLAIGRDITRAQRAVEALRASEARYRALAEATTQVIWGAGPNGSLDDDASAGWLTYTGQALDDSNRTGNEWLAAVHPDDRERAWAAWSHAVRTETVYDVRYRVQRNDGTWRIVIARAAPVRAANGEILEWIGTISDVTDHAALTAALHESERRLATLLRHVPGMAYRFRAEASHRFEILSDGVLELTGYRAPELLQTEGQTFRDLIVADDRERVASTISAAISSGQSFEVTYRIACANADQRVVWEQGRCVPSTDSAVPVVEGLVVDVTDRERALETLQAERTHLDHAQRLARLGSWNFERGAFRLRSPDQWAEILGVREDELQDPVSALGRRIVLEEREAFVERLAALDQQRPAHVESRWRIQRDDGAIRVLQLRALWQYGEDGRRAAGTGTVQDVTDEVAAEFEIVRQRALLEESQRLAHVGSWEVDLATNAIVWSEEMYHIAGFPRDHGVISRAFADTMIVAEEVERVRARVSEAVETGQPVEYEHRLRRADGALRTLVTRVRPILGHDGTAARIVGASQDVTDRRRLDEQLRQTQKMEALGVLAGSIAHDFNNLLSAILGGAELARVDVPDGTSIAEDLDDIRKAGLRAAELTRRLLTFSRRQSRSPTVLDLGKSVRDAERLLRRLLPPDVALDIISSSSPCVVLADPGQLEQVYMNLVVNARDAIMAAHSQSGAGESHIDALISVSVELRAVSSEDSYPAARDGTPLPAGTYAALCVRDNGIGMDSNTRQRIFEPFFTTKAEGKGTGLGLATVFGIVAQHDGAIHCESDEGAGTTFTILLPHTEATVDSSRVVRSRAPSGAETLLLVEDERLVRAMATRVLQRNGYRVISAQHGDDAMLAWREHGSAIDALVTDIRMPVMDGSVLAKALRAERPDLPLVLMSGYTLGTAAEAELLQQEIFLEKPFTAETLLVAVREALDRR